MKHLNFSSSFSVLPNKSFCNIPPLLLLYTEKTSINYLSNIILWNDLNLTSIYTFKDLIKTVPVQYIPIKQTIKINFLDCTPDKITVYDSILDYDGNLMYSQKETILSYLTPNNKMYEYILPENVASLFSSQYKENKFDIRGITLKAFFEENECDYIFLIKTDPL